MKLEMFCLDDSLSMVEKSAEEKVYYTEKYF